LHTSIVKAHFIYKYWRHPYILNFWYSRQHILIYDMKIIDAVWEKRNLGLRVGEIQFERTDLIDALHTPLPFGSYDYLVAKVPTNMLPLVHKLERLKFYFLETQFDLKKDLRKGLQIPQEFSWINDRVNTSVISDTNRIEEILAKIDSSMFDSDRVSIDPLLGSKPGAERYRNWIRDEMSRGEAVLVELSLEGASIGFFLLSNFRAEYCFSTLAGIYSEFKGCGFGLSAIAMPIIFAKEQKAKFIHTVNSSNNQQSLKIHLACGYSIENISYVFRWMSPDLRLPEIL